MRAGSRDLVFPSWDEEQSTNVFLVLKRGSSVCSQRSRTLETEFRVNLNPWGRLPQCKPGTPARTVACLQHCGSPGRWTRWEGPCVPPLSRARGAELSPPAKGSPSRIRGCLRQGSSRESSSSVVLGSEPRLEWFILASQCWSCLLPGCRGRDGSVPPPSPCSGARGMLFRGCFFHSLSLADGRLPGRGRGGGFHCRAVFRGSSLVRGRSRWTMLWGSTWRHWESRSRAVHQLPGP